VSDDPFPVRTERLTLRRGTESDVDTTWRFRRLPEVSAWLTHVEGDADYEDYRTRFLDPERLEKVLVIELDGEVIGDLMIKLEDAWAQNPPQPAAEKAQAELGWTLHPDHWGHGYAKEAVSALIGTCFTHLGVRRVTAACFADNTASWQLMERLGMRREAHWVKESLHRSGEWLDAFHYALHAEEWNPPVVGETGKRPSRSRP